MSGASGLIAGEGDEVVELAERLREEPRALSVLLRGLVERRGAPLVLIVDQLEELFTLQDDVDVQRAFMIAICTAADDYADPLRVMFTVRDDYLGRIVVAPEVRDAMRLVTVLRPLDAITMAEGLRRTAALAGYRFEDDELPEEMVREVVQGAGALPLVQFAAQQLWRLRDRERKILTREAHDAMGGVTGALAAHADGVLDGLTEGQLRVARRILLRLVTPEQTRRIVPRDDLLEADDERDVLDRFVNARLVTTRRARRGDPSTCELAHEALIGRWETLARWLDESRDDRAQIAEIDDAAALWDKRGRRDAELWQGGALRDARRFLDRSETAPERALEFVEAGEQRERGRRLRGRLALGAVLVGLTAVALVLSYQKQRADRAAVEASEQLEQTKRRKAEADRQASRAAFTSRSMLEARALLRASLEGRDDVLTRALWWQLERDPELWTRDFDTVIYDGAFSPDGSHIALAGQDRLIYEADVVTRQLRRYRGHRDQVQSVAYVGGGSGLVSGAWGGQLFHFDRRSGKAEALRAAAVTRLARLRSSADQRWLVVQSKRGHDRLLRTSNWQEIELPGAPYDVLAVGPSGNHVVGITADGEVRAIDAERGRVSTSMTIEPRGGTTLALRMDAGRVAVGDDGSGIRMLDLSAKKVVYELSAPRGPVMSLSFSPDGRLLLSSSRTGPPRLWDAERGQLLQAIPTELSIWARFSEDGQKLAYANIDRVGLFHVPRLLALPRESLHRPVYGSAFAPSADLVATGSFDGVVEVWSVERGKVEYRYVVGPDTVHALVFVDGGTNLAVASADGHLTKLEVATGRTLWRRQMGNVLQDVRLSPSGEVLLTTGDEGRLSIVAVAAGNLVAEGHWGIRRRRRAVFADDEVVIAGDSEGGLTRWRIGEKEASLDRAVTEGGVFGLAVDDERRVYVAAGRGRLLRISDLGEGEVEVLENTPGGRYLDVDIGPDGAWLSADSAGLCRRHVDGEDSRTLHRSNMETNQSRFSAQGELALCAGDDGALRLWDVKAGRPRWHTAGLLPRGRLHALGRRQVLEGGASESRPYEATIDQDVRYVDEMPSGDVACVVHRNGDVAYWETKAAQPKARHAVPGRALRVLASKRGCLVSTEDALWRIGEKAEALAERPARWLDRDAAGRPFALLGTDVVDLEGEGRAVVSPYVTAVARLAEQEVHGYRDGNLVVARLAEGRASPDFAQTPSSPVVSITAGPPGTVIVGFENGLVGMWDLTGGQRLAADYLHGPVRYLRLESERLIAASELGQHLIWDLSVFYRPYCELLADVWRQVPVSPSGGRVERREPDPKHPCRRQ